MPTQEMNELVVERYRYILQQMDSMNKSVEKFLTIFQTATTALAGAGILLWVNYQKWQIAEETMRSAELAIGITISAIGAFICFCLISGAISWIDYRREECILTDQYVHPGFRPKPTLKNFWRWYEFYVVLLIAVTIILIWILGGRLVS